MHARPQPKIRTPSSNKCVILIRHLWGCLWLVKGRWLCILVCFRNEFFGCFTAQLRLPLLFLPQREWQERIVNRHFNRAAIRLRWVLKTYTISWIFVLRLVLRLVSRLVPGRMPSWCNSAVLRLSHHTSILDENPKSLPIEMFQYTTETSNTESWLLPTPKYRRLAFPVAQGICLGKRCGGVLFRFANSWCGFLLHNVFILLSFCNFRSAYFGILYAIIGKKEVYLNRSDGNVPQL